MLDGSLIATGPVFGVIHVMCPSAEPPPSFPTVLITVPHRFMSFFHVCSLSFFVESALRVPSSSPSRRDHGSSYSVDTACHFRHVVITATLACFPKRSLPPQYECRIPIRHLSRTLCALVSTVAATRVSCYAPRASHEF